MGLELKRSRLFISTRRGMLPLPYAMMVPDATPPPDALLPLGTALQVDALPPPNAAPPPDAIALVRTMKPVRCTRRV